MTATMVLIERYRAATPCERFDIKAALERDYGAGFARLFCDLVEADELIRSNERAIRAIPRERKVLPFRPRVVAAA